MSTAFDIKITDVQVAYPSYRRTLGGLTAYLWQIVVRVETAAGITGYRYSGCGVAGVEALSHHLRELFLDEDCGKMGHSVRYFWGGNR